MKQLTVRFANANRVFALKVLMIVVVCSLYLSCVQVSAQDIKGIPTLPNAASQAGTVLSQFMKGIKPSSFIDSWAKEKGGWLSAVGKIKDVPGMIKNITSLSKFIKPSMFKSGFSAESLMKTASTAKTMADAGNLLKNLEGGMKPEAMVDGWAGKKNSWLSALNMLK